MQTSQLRSSLKPDSDAGAAPQGEVWIGIEVGGDEGRRWLASQSGLDDEIIARLLEPAPTSYWRRFGQGLRFHLCSPVPDQDTSTTRIVDFAFWLEPGRVITVRQGQVPALPKAAEACSTGAGPSNPRDLLSLLIDRASALQGQIRDQLSDSMNTATYRFTWVATVFLPLSFLTGLLGINVAGIPGDHDPVAFWLVCGVLCVIAAAWGIAVGRVTSPFRRRGGPRHDEH
jgi:Mg2+ and Co2+ transporter CorA